MSLKTIYLLSMTAVFSVALVMFAVFDLSSQKQQAEDAMLEEARTFADEMDAVWQFIDNSQSIINYTSDGTYEFKGLHCAVVGKSIGAIFSADNDYAIRYVNLNPRNYQGTPDDYETEALEAFNEDSSITEWYGIAEYEGEEVFRYVLALEVDESCLECHGEPAGELDITGNEKEGWTLDTVGGAISIVIPTDLHDEAMMENFVVDVVYFLLIALVIGAVVWIITTVFVFRPLGRMKLAFGALQEGSFDITLDDARTARELSQLMQDFNRMAGELRGVYSSLEEQVDERTDELQRANEELERQRDNLERLNKKLGRETEFKTDLLSIVNHELRTPLTSIITFTQTARDAELRAGRTDVAAWDEVERNAQILLRMINDMLDAARSDAGSMPVTLEPVDLGDIVANVRGTMQPLAESFNVEFSAHVAADVPLVTGDYDKIARMLENLSNNAIKFTPDGGCVDLTVERAAGAGGVVLRVADTGIGIAPEDQERIFEKFVQVDSTSTRRYSGSGLGLSLVKEYAEVQGYAVGLESELGRGSTFTVTIPEAMILDGGVEDDYDTLIGLPEGADAGKGDDADV